MSGLLGGTVNLVAGLVYGALVRMGRAGTVGDALRTMFRAEAAKITVIVLGLWLGLTRFPALEHLSFMSVFLITVLVGPFASLRTD